MGEAETLMDTANLGTIKRLTGGALPTLLAIRERPLTKEG